MGLAQKQGIVLTSYVLDSSITLSKQELGGFDHIVITDQAWLDMTTSSDSPSHATLQPYDPATMPAPMKQFLDGQLPLLLAPGVTPRYFTVASGKMLALPPNVGLSSASVQTNNSLIIVIDDAASAFKSGFTLPALSSGNIVFTDVHKLKTLLSGTLLGRYVIGTEEIADLALGQSQKFASEASYYLAACVMLLIAIGFGAGQRAMLWSSQNRRRIFAAHTYGIRYPKIFQPQMSGEFVLIGVALAAGMGLSLFMQRSDIGYLVGSAVAIALIYIITARFVFYGSTRRAFASVVHRSE